MRETMAMPDLNKSKHAVKTMPSKKRARSQVAVASTLVKKRTYLTAWLQSGSDPKPLSCAHTHKNQIVNTAVESIWIEMRRIAREAFLERVNLFLPASSYLVST